MEIQERLWISQLAPRRQIAMEARSERFDPTLAAILKLDAAAELAWAIHEATAAELAAEAT